MYIQCLSKTPIVQHLAGNILESWDINIWVELTKSCYVWDYCPHSVMRTAIDVGKHNLNGNTGVGIWLIQVYHTTYLCVQSEYSRVSDNR